MNALRTTTADVGPWYLPTALRAQRWDAFDAGDHALVYALTVRIEEAERASMAWLPECVVEPMRSQILEHRAATWALNRVCYDLPTLVRLRALMRVRGVCVRPDHADIIGREVEVWSGGARVFWVRPTDTITRRREGDALVLVDGWPDTSALSTDEAVRAIVEAAFVALGDL